MQAEIAIQPNKKKIKIMSYIHSIDCKSLYFNMLESCFFNDILLLFKS